MRTTWIALLLGLFLSATALAAPSAESFGTLPDIRDAAISPDARQIAIIVNAKGTFAVRVLKVDEPDEPIRAIGLPENVKPTWIRWVNNDRVLVGLFQFQRYRGRASWISFIYTMDANTMVGDILVKPKNLRRQDNADVIDFLDDDPDHILMSFSDVDQFVNDIQRVNVATGRSRRLKRGLAGIQSWYTDQRGEPRVGQGRLDKDGDDFTWRLVIRENGDDKWRSADDFPGLAADTKIIGFNENPDELLIGHNADKDTMGIYVYDLAKKEIGRRLFHHNEYDATGLIRNSNGEIIGARYIADEPHAELFGQHDTHMQRMRQSFPDFNIGFIDQSNDGSRLIFRISNSSDPGSLLLSDSANNRVFRISYNRSKLAAAEMGSVHAIRYAAKDGVSIPAYVTLPPSIDSLEAARNIPTIILPHGGPYSRSYKRFDYFAQFFATRGFVVLQMNFRGSAGYGEEYEEAGRNNWVLMQEDVEDATRWALSEGIADPERTCIVGWSYGGYTALMGAIKNPELYACAVSIAGVTDLQNLVNDVRKVRFGETRANKFIKSGFEDKNAMKDNSPVRRAEELQVPLFLAHAEQDLNVHFDHFQKMKSALKKSEIPVDYLEVDNDDHYFSVQENRQTLFVELDAFLASTVGESQFAK
ncbi:MAG: alpha/beta hydrolase family protein [Woeseiaceae bacterium]